MGRWPNNQPVHVPIRSAPPGAGGDGGGGVDVDVSGGALVVV